MPPIISGWPGRPRRIGSDQVALEMYGQAIEKARANETIDGVSLAGAARDQKFRLLVRLAASARKAGKWDAGRRSTRDRPERSPGPANERLEAQLLLADVLLDASQPRDAVAICQRLLSDDRLRSLPVAAADGHRTVRADLLIADRLKSIVAPARPRRLRSLSTRKRPGCSSAARKRKILGFSIELCRAYPEARVIPDALFELGLLHEQARRLADASHTYKRLQIVATDDDRRVAGPLAAGARLRGEAASWSRPATRLPRAAGAVSQESTGRPRRRSGTGRRAGGGRAGAAACMRRSSPTVPSRRLRCRSSGDGTGNPERSQPVQALCRLWSACRRSTPAASFWSRKPVCACSTPRPERRAGRRISVRPAVWAGYLSDKLIVATARQIAALELSQGTVQWRFDCQRPARTSDRPDPFANPAEAGDRPEPAGPSLSVFRLVKGRVFCLRNRTELIAIDGDTGALDWSFSSPPGEINPNLWIGADRAVVADRQAQSTARAANRRRPAGQPSAARRERAARAAAHCRSMRIRCSWSRTAAPSNDST